MPNYCDYEIKIVGKKENVEKLFSYLKSDYSYTAIYDKDKKHYVNKLSFCEADKHFFRVFDADRLEAEEIDKDTYILIVGGYCAWSVYSCMMKGEYTYYDDLKKTVIIDDFRGTNMLEATKDLNLKVEIFSSEPGCEFMEHYIIDKGEIKVDEESEYKTIYNEDTCEYKEIGGFEWDYTI